MLPFVNTSGPCIPGEHTCDSRRIQSQ